MRPSDARYQAYLKILQQELIPATGCTEPIAIAYAAAKARDVLAAQPDRVEVRVSGSIVKNAKSVIVPGTDRKKGIKTAVAAGLVAGKSEMMLEVISEISELQRYEIGHFVAQFPINIQICGGENQFEIQIKAYSGTESAAVRIVGSHTNIVSIHKNEEMIYKNDTGGATPATGYDYELLTIADIIEFADDVDLRDVEAPLGQQVLHNASIADEGLQNDYGANIGKTVLRLYDASDVRVQAKARTAAASDARMGGCTMPVVITAGSGNQGLTTSVPVITYAAHLGATQEALYRALVVANLTTIHQKTSIGKLSAFCGAVSAGAGAAAGITYLQGGRFAEVSHTVVNALGILSGMICDGAKPSCAAKIAAAVDAGIFGYEMYKSGQQFYRGDGIIAQDVEATIRNIGRLGRDGMRETDREILEMMIQCDTLPVV